MKSKELPRTGRPVKTPSNEALKNFGPLSLVVKDTVAILKKCGAPFAKPILTEADRRHRIEQLRRADQITQMRPLPDERYWGESEALLILKCLHAPMLLGANENDSHLRSVPLAFARLFAEAPNAMIRALPKIKSLLHKHRRTPKQAVAFDYTLRRDERFWSAKSDLLASELSKTLRMPITPKVIEHAREMLRNQLNTFPRTSK